MYRDRGIYFSKPARRTIERVMLYYVTHHKKKIFFGGRACISALQDPVLTSREFLFSPVIWRVRSPRENQSVETPRHWLRIHRVVSVGSPDETNAFSVLDGTLRNQHARSTVTSDLAGFVLIFITPVLHSEGPFNCKSSPNPVKIYSGSPRGKIWTIEVCVDARSGVVCACPLGRRGICVDREGSGYDVLWPTSARSRLFPAKPSECLIERHYVVRVRLAIQNKKTQEGNSGSGPVIPGFSLS